MARHEEREESFLYPVLSAEKMFSYDKHAELLEKFEKESGLDHEEFDLFYGALFRRYADYVQCLPDLRAKPADMMLFNNGLERAFAAMVQAKRVILPEHEQLLYAVTSAALLYHIGSIQSGRRVFICNEQGEALYEWFPLDGPVIVFGEYYKDREAEAVLMMVAWYAEWPDHANYSAARSRLATVLVNS